MNRHTAVTGTVAALGGAAGPWTYAQQSAPEQVPAFRTGVEAVSVDVGVVDKQGQPVRDLTPADFRVTVAGRARRVITAEFVDASPSGRTLAYAPDADAISTNEGDRSGRMVMFVLNGN